MSVFFQADTRERVKSADNNVVLLQLLSCSLCMAYFYTNSSALLN